MNYLFWIMERDLSNGHAAIFSKVGPGRVDYRNIISLVALHVDTPNQLQVRRMATA